MEVAIVTGVSKGLGKAVAKRLLKNGISVYGISRGNSEQFKEVEQRDHVNYEHFSCDLGDTVAIEQTVELLDEKISEKRPSKIYLINNAAVLEPINHVMNIETSDLVYHVHVNTIAPMLMMNFLLKKATSKNIRLIGMNITSGAAERPIYGWSTYCSTKASINMYTKTVALEQEQLNTGHKVIAFSPGIMDTKMQEQIRSSSHEAFVDVDTFKGYYHNNDLRDPDTVAKVIVNIITAEDQIKNGKIYYVNDYIPS